MKKVLLIDVDSKIPNLALMQISAYHKSKGDEVRFTTRDPDLVYISCVFKKNGPCARGIEKFYPDAKVYIGGSGVNYSWLPEEMQKIKPDYQLYTRDRPDLWYSLGFTTRGCIRKCDFCIVPQKEGKIHRWQHISEFHDDRFKTVILLDNNWYADKEWFWENTQYLIDNDLKVIEHGMDIRILTPEIAKRLNELKWAKSMHFAFDNIKDEKWVERGISILKEAGINVRQKVLFYVIVGFNSTPKEDLYRCELLKELGTTPFVMQYERNSWTREIADWVNRPWTFWSCDFKDLKRKKRTVV